MADLETYFNLIKEYPHLFNDSDEKGAIRIITDPKIIAILESEKKAELKKQGLLEKWIDIGVLGEDQWFYIVRDLVEFPDGRIGGYLRVLNRKSVEGGYGVAILVQDCIN